MKRSEINAILRQTDVFIRANGFHLPPFAHWTPEDWAGKGPEEALRSSKESTAGTSHHGSRCHLRPAETERW